MKSLWFTLVRHQPRSALSEPGRAVFNGAGGQAGALLLLRCVSSAPTQPRLLVGAGHAAPRQLQGWLCSPCAGRERSPAHDRDGRAEDAQPGSGHRGGSGEALEQWGWGQRCARPGVSALQLCSRRTGTKIPSHVTSLLGGTNAWDSPFLPRPVRSREGAQQPCLGVGGKPHVSA